MSTKRHLSPSAVIASVHASITSDSYTGPVLGLQNAEAVLNALQDAHYVVVQQHEINNCKEALTGAIAILDRLHWGSTT